MTIRRRRDVQGRPGAQGESRQLRVPPASALDDRPLRFDEFERLPRRCSCPPPRRLRERTRGRWSSSSCARRLVDPMLDGPPGATQVDDLLSEINLRAEKQERVLVTTLTKRMAEDLTDYLNEHGVTRPAISTRHRHCRAGRDHPRSAPGRVRRAGRDRSAARRARHPGGVAGRDPRRRTRKGSCAPSAG